MHPEWAELSPEVAAIIESRRSQRGRIVAVGTTSARVLETASAGGTLQSFSGETNLFIRPGHVFRGLDALITNFHLPRSSCSSWSALLRVSISFVLPMPKLSEHAIDSIVTATRC